VEPGTHPPARRDRGSGGGGERPGRLRGPGDGASGPPRQGRVPTHPPLLPDAATDARPRPGRPAARRTGDSASHRGAASIDPEAEFEAFQDHWGNRERSEDSFTATLSKAELDTDLWIVAWDGDQIAGVVENWIWTEENEELGVKRGWLERISVRRPWRRRGLARSITAASLVRLREAGMHEGMLGVDSENANGALGLYEGLGFEVHSRSAVYRRPLER